MKHHVFVLLALGLSGNLWADDAHDARPHTHWWMELDPSWYAGAALGQSTFKNAILLPDDGSFTSRSVDDRDTGMRLFAGVDLGRHFALEAGYTDFGEASGRAQSDGSGTVWSAGAVAEDVSLEGLDVELLGKVPVTDDWRLFGRVGMLLWESSAELSGDFQCCGPATYREPHDRTAFSYGAGVHYDGLRPLRVVVDYHTSSFRAFGGTSGTEVESIGISLAYLF